MPIDSSDLIPIGLSGNVTIQHKSAQFTKTIVSDAKFEGTEKFIARLRKGSVTGNIVASSGAVAILDTSSTSPLPTYSLAANKTSTNEGSTVIVALTTTNLSAGSLVPYTISGNGITTDDIGGTPLTGTFTLSGAGTASVTIPITADHFTEGFETLTLTLDDVTPSVSVSIVINDTSETPPQLPTYSLTTNVNAIDEGQSVTFTLTTTNLPNGNLVPYIISGDGITSGDIGIPLTGNFTIGPSGIATLVVTATNDVLTEGVEALTVTLGNVTPTVSQSVTIRDTSTSPNLPTYSLRADKSSVNEGDSVTFILTTTNVANGTLIPYSLSGAGITSGDIGGEILAGDFTVSGGLANVTFNIAADALNEGPETLTMTLDGITPSVSAVVIINDTSKASLVPSYALGANKSTINEGDSVTIKLTTVNVSAGTLIPYSITGTGITSSDIGAPLTGNFSVSASGTAETSITLTAVADTTTEGREVLTVSLVGIIPVVSVSVNIEDTSKSPTASYALTTEIVGYNQTYINTAQKITINSYFNRYLGRNAELEGLTFYDNKLNSGTATLSEVETAIRTSPEAQAWDGRPSAIERSDVIKITLTTSNVASGTQVPYTITGVNSADISQAPTTGSFTVGADGKATLLLTTSPDSLTEGTETLTITINGTSTSASMRILDTSTSPGYTLSASVNTVNEGSSVTITLGTNSISNGTLVPFTLSGTGINNNDLSSSGLIWNAAANRFEGSFNVQNNTASITVNITADGTTEGSETFNVTLTTVTPTVTKSITINDTSVTQTGSATMSTPGYLYSISTLPTDAAWLAFKMIGAGGSGAATDLGGNSGAGFSFATNGNWTAHLNRTGIVGPGNPFTFTVPIYFPFGGNYTFVFATDNSGYFTIDNGQQYSWNSYTSDLTVAVTVAVGLRNLFVSCTNVSGATGVGLQIYFPDGRPFWNTRQYAAAAGGSGGAGNYVEGVVLLPATPRRKVVRVGVGQPGPGGAKYGNSGFEAGGSGFQIGGWTGSTFSTTDVQNAVGGKGGSPGGSGQSGGGGAGGGATALYMTPEDPVSSSDTYQIATIAVAGGGGGGGGKSLNQSGLSHAQLSTLYSSGGHDGAPAAGSDGGGGGGGGGGASSYYGSIAIEATGLGGRGGQDNGQLSSGGAAGKNFKNNQTPFTWDSWRELVTTTPAGTTGGSHIYTRSEVPQPFGAIQFGRGGAGSITEGDWGSQVGIAGSPGAVAIYWTTSPTPPSLSLVPQFTEPGVTMSMPSAQDAPSGVTFYGNGTLLVEGIIKSWYVGGGINGLGEWYEIKFNSGNPSNGSAKGTLITNVPEGTWQVMYGNGSKGYYCQCNDGYIDVTVSIRRRTTGTLSTTTFRNIGVVYPGDYLDSGGPF